MLTVAAAVPYRSKICLNGVWEGCFTQNQQISGNVAWFPVRIPSSWGGQGRTAWNLPPESKSAIYGNFRLKLDIPKEWKGKCLKLIFEFIADGHRVFWNGRKIHESPTKMVWSEISIPEEVVHFGEQNEIVVQTEGPGTTWITGIPRNVFLSALPPVSIRFAHVRTSVQNHRIDVKTSLENKTGTPLSVELIAEVQNQGKTILTLPVQKTLLRENAAVLTGKEWKDPILWGFGEYGKPHLYTLKTELKINGKTADVKYDRFGFREFRTRGDKFLLNEKPIYLKGDVGTHTRPHIEHPAAVTAYYQMMRNLGYNLQRLHTGNNFDPSVWFEIADEVGFLVETETWRLSAATLKDGKRQEKILNGDDPISLKLWENYVNANFNHPSIILWCTDNESFQTGLTTVDKLRKIDLKRLQSYDRLSQFIRTLDPTRIVDMHDNHGIYAFVKQNQFSRESFRIFNFHPYGNLKQEINTEIKNLGFQGEMPVLIGEIFAFGKAVDFVHNPNGAYAELWRMGNSFYTQILQAASAKHVAGVITCGQCGDGRIGYQESKVLRLGPWDSFAQKKENGALAGIREFDVIPSYPSLSGPGVKAEKMQGWVYFKGAFPLNMNWFDPTVPMYYFTTVDDNIKKGMYEITQSKTPPLSSTRCPEVVVAAGTENAGKMITLEDPVRTGASLGVIADPQGTAYFRLPGPGTYKVFCGKETGEFTIRENPPLREKPGYDYLNWVELVPGSSAPLKKELNRPARKIVKSLDRQGEFIKNRDFEYWEGKQPYHWNLRGDASATTQAKSGKYALRLRGIRNEAVQEVRLQKDKIYRISCDIMKGKGKGVGCIQLSDAKWKNLLTCRGKEKNGEWQTVSTDYLANGSERYLYLKGLDCDANTELLFDNVSLKLVDSKKEAFKPGPFSLGEKGHIRNWLILGPFPNPGNALDGYLAAKTDYLQQWGGEANQKPVFHQERTAVFRDGSYWTAGSYKIRWTQLHMKTGMENLHVQLPEANISGTPPDHIAAYLACELNTDRACRIRLNLNSDDGYVLYLNGQKVGEFLGNRGAVPSIDAERFPVELKKGKNLLLVKSIQESGRWQFFCRLTELDGSPCQGIRITLPGRRNLLKNPDFTGKATEKGIPNWWFSKGFVCKEFQKRKAVKLTGSTGQGVQALSVKPGAKYRVSAWIYTTAPWKVIGLTGSVGLRDMKYKWLIQLTGSNQVWNWEYVEGICTIPENVNYLYFYLFNNFIVQSESVWYSEPKLELLDGEK